MNGLRLLALTTLGAAAFASPVEARSKLSDAQIKQQIIAESIASYPGPCACPYNTARNGSRCGGRSAWSRRGGYAPACFDSDVSKADVEAWRSSH